MQLEFILNLYLVSNKCLGTLFKKGYLTNEKSFAFITKSKTKESGVTQQHRQAGSLFIKTCADCFSLQKGWYSLKWLFRKGLKECTVELKMT